MTTERPATPGDLCTCGRQATTVYIAEHGQVGYCGLPGVPRLTPCPWCDDTDPHTERCPDYQLRRPLPVFEDDDDRAYVAWVASFAPKDGQR